jgi:hypothetical protein
MMKGLFFTRAKRLDAVSSKSLRMGQRYMEKILTEDRQKKGELMSQNISPTSRTLHGSSARIVAVKTVFEKKIHRKHQDFTAPKHV